VTLASARPLATPDVAVALDVSDASRALDLVDRMGPACRWVKVGLQLYTAEGPDLTRELKRRGLSVFLDLKLHDIPNTVAGAVESAAALDVDLLTVHAVGGAAMLAAAAEARGAVGGPLRIIAVTVLTSLSRQELARSWGRSGSDLDVAREVERLARLAQDHGIDGVVSSALEAAELRAALGPQAILVTPGVRLPGDDAGDQARVATPAAAVQAGADLLVVGRPVTQAADPAQALERVVASMAAGREVGA